MAGERQSQNALPGEDSPGETILAEAWVPGAGNGLERLLRLCATHLSRGEAAVAFAELVKASRAGPLEPRLAAALVRIALEAGTASAALKLFDEAREIAEGEVLIALERQHVRLLRRMGEHARALKVLEGLLLLKPQDRRARRTVQWVLEKSGNWEALDAALEAEGREAHRRFEWRRAAAAAVRRARVAEARFQDPGRAVLRLGQAALILEEGVLDAEALPLRIRWFEALIAHGAAPHAISDAARTLVRIATRARRLELADEVLERHGLSREGKPREPAPFGVIADGDVGALGFEDTDVRTPAVDDPFEELPTAASEPPPTIEFAPASSAAFGPSAGPAGEIQFPLESASPPAPELGEAAPADTDAQLLRQREAQFVARGDWKELAAFYRQRAQRATRASEVADVLTRLAELLETELENPIEAAAVYGELVARTGDRHALIEQVRLLREAGDALGLRRALDVAVREETGESARFGGLLLRAQHALDTRDPAGALGDFKIVLEREPQNPEALLGQLEAASRLDLGIDPQPAHRALESLPRTHPSRTDWVRRFARAVRDPALSEWAWNEVALAAPDEEEAQDELLTTLRRRGDDAALVAVLQRLLAREPRGIRARPRRRELWSALDRLGRTPEALQEIRLAARYEPGHREAWLALFERLAESGVHEEAAWALEHATTSTEDDLEREALWRRLADFCRDVLNEPDRASVYAGRAAAMRRDREISAAEAAATLARRTGASGKHAAITPRRAAEPPAPRAEPRPPLGEEPERASARQAGIAPARSAKPPVPRAEPPSGRHRAIEPPAHEQTELAADARAPDADDRLRTEIEVPIVAAPPPRAPAPPPAPPPAEADPLEVTSGDFVVPDEALLGADAPIAATSHHVAGSHLKSSLDQERLFERVRARPLESDGYRALAESFGGRGEAPRAALMLEIADSLDGRGAEGEEAPQLMLSATDRAGLRHPTLREGAGELLSLAGHALCRLFPAKGRMAGSREEFRIDSGRGARQAADALLAAVRILGLRAPDVYLAEDNGPPFSLAWTQGPRLLVGRTAVDYPLPPAELRFFAGRALFTQTPDLMVLRALRKEQLYAALEVLGRAVKPSRGGNPEVKLVRSALAPKSLERIRALYEQHAPTLRYGVLADAARHSANRAGLAVCGAVTPALDALRAKKALAREMEELIRFAASERHLQLRRRGSALRGS